MIFPARMVSLTITHGHEVKNNRVVIIAMLELKLDQTTMFEWQRHRQDSKNVLHSSALLDFIDLRA